MKFLSARDLRNRSSYVWNTLRKQRDMVVTNNGKPVAVISSVNEETLDMTLSAFRQARAEKAVAAVQYESLRKRTDTISMDQIDAEIRKARKQRRR